MSVTNIITASLVRGCDHGSGGTGGPGLILIRPKQEAST